MASITAFYFPETRFGMGRSDPLHSMMVGALSTDHVTEILTGMAESVASYLRDNIKRKLPRIPKEHRIVIHVPVDEMFYNIVHRFEKCAVSIILRPAMLQCKIPKALAFSHVERFADTNGYDFVFKFAPVQSEVRRPRRRDNRHHKST